MSDTYKSDVIYVHLFCFFVCTNKKRNFFMHVPHVVWLVIRRMRVYYTDIYVSFPVATNHNDLWFAILKLFFICG